MDLFRIHKNVAHSNGYKNGKWWYDSIISVQWDTSFIMLDYLRHTAAATSLAITKATKNLNNLNLQNLHTNLSIQLRMIQSKRRMQKTSVEAIKQSQWPIH
jgi:hypothetical protein